MTTSQTNLPFDTEADAIMDEASKSATKKVARKRTAKKAAVKKSARKAAAKAAAEEPVQASPAVESVAESPEKAPARRTTRKRSARKSAFRDADKSDEGGVSAPPLKAPSLSTKNPDGEPVPHTYSSDADPVLNPAVAKKEPEPKAEKPEPSQQPKASETKPPAHHQQRDAGRGHKQDRPNRQKFKQKPFSPDRNRPQQQGNQGPNNDNNRKPNHPANNNSNNNDRKRNKKERNKGRRDGRRRDRSQESDLDAVIETGNLYGLRLFRDETALKELAKELAAGDGEAISLNALLEMVHRDLIGFAAEHFNIHYTQAAPARDQVIDAILDAAQAARRAIYAEGIVEVTDEGDGLLVFTSQHYRIRPNSAFIAKPFMRRFGLKRGTILEVQLHAKRKVLPDDALEQLKAAGIDEDQDDGVDVLPDRVEEALAEKALSALFPATDYLQEVDADEETCPYVIDIRSIMGKAPEDNLSVTPFEDLVPYYPTERIILETEPKVKWDNIAMRTVDLLTPVGLGQRGLIVAPPRTGKTILQQSIANAIAVNKPDTHLIILLIDERPEEVTDFRRQITSGEVIASTFDESPENHVHCAEMVIEKARRMVEAGRDVIILLDSITRLARAYNALASNSGKILSGGVEANALQKPKRFFGSARNIEEGGSLTIIGTALVETGSRMDEVIFEEFKGTGNMELHLDRQLSDKRIFPAIEMAKSGTRKEELLYHPDEMAKVYGLRRAMKGVPPTDAMEMLISRIKKTATNIQFLVSLNS